MISIFKTVEDTLLPLTQPESGCWVNLCAPDEQELERVSQWFNMDIDFLRAALDEEERARIESEDGHTLIVVDIPVIQAESKGVVYSTIPLGIVLTEDHIITVTLKEAPIIQDFILGRVRTFYTYKRTRFILQLLYRNSTRFLQYLKQIDHASTRVENALHLSMRNKELIQMLRLEKSLVYFSTSLKANEVVLERMLRMDYVRKYPDDTELLEDVIVENKQAIEMCTIYRDILSGTMDAFASVISNNLNIVMKRLTAITIIMTIPTLIAGLWGMNVPLPFDNMPGGFWVISVIALASSVLALLWMRKKEML